MLFLFHRKTVEDGLPEKSIIVNMKGSGGQSFCAFLARGVHVTLEGDANDYVGKVSLLWKCCVPVKMFSLIMVPYYDTYNYVCDNWNSWVEMHGFVER